MENKEDASINEYEEVVDSSSFDEVEKVVILSSGTIISQDSLDQIMRTTGLDPFTREPIEIDPVTGRPKTIPNYAITQIQTDYRRIKKERDDLREEKLKDMMNDMKSELMKSFNTKFDEQEKKFNEQTGILRSEIAELRIVNAQQEREINILKEENHHLNAQAKTFNLQMEEVRKINAEQKKEIDRLKEENDNLIKDNSAKDQLIGKLTRERLKSNNVPQNKPFFSREGVRKSTKDEDKSLFSCCFDSARARASDMI